jgi:hypothetical protein
MKEWIGGVLWQCRKRINEEHAALHKETIVFHFNTGSGTMLKN